MLAVSAQLSCLSHCGRQTPAACLGAALFAARTARPINKSTTHVYQTDAGQQPEAARENAPPYLLAAQRL